MTQAQVSLGLLLEQLEEINHFLQRVNLRQGLRSSENIWLTFGEADIWWRAEQEMKRKMNSDDTIWDPESKHAWNQTACLDFWIIWHNKPLPFWGMWGPTWLSTHRFCVTCNMKSPKPNQDLGHCMLFTYNFKNLLLKHWRRKWQPTPVFLLGKFHGKGSLEGYSPRGCKELDTSEHTHTLKHRVKNNTPFLWGPLCVRTQVSEHTPLNTLCSGTWEAPLRTSRGSHFQSSRRDSW